MLWLDAFLSFAHFLFVFVLLTTLGGEAFVLRLPLTGASMKLLGEIDRAYGVSAMLLVAAGVSRVLWGAKGGGYYLHEPFFWAKMALFVIIALISIIPTKAFMRWRKSLKHDPAFLPDDKERARVQGLVLTQLRLIVLLVVFAVLMARGIGAS